MSDNQKQGERIILMPEILEENMTGEQKMLWAITSLTTNVNELKTAVAKHHKVLIEGNGELPLVEKVRNIQVFIDSTKYWLRFLVGALLLQTIAFVGMAVTYLIRLAPIIDNLSK